jgi:NCS1 family nucleobase:cation symporter-1
MDFCALRRGCSLSDGTRRRQALPAIVLGNILLGMVFVLSGTIGARLHIPFPVINRSSFGFWLSYFSIISRVVLSLFWFGIQSTIGSECVYQVWFCSYHPFTSIIWSSFQMLKAIWPSIAHLPNRLPPSAHLTSSGTHRQLVISLDRY